MPKSVIECSDLSAAEIKDIAAISLKCFKLISETKSGIMGTALNEVLEDKAIFLAFFEKQRTDDLAGCRAAGLAQRKRVYAAHVELFDQQLDLRRLAHTVGAVDDDKAAGFGLGARGGHWGSLSERPNHGESGFRSAVYKGERASPRIPVRRACRRP